jgi:hypothetical protein
LYIITPTSFLRVILKVYEPSYYRYVGTLNFKRILNEFYRVIASHKLSFPVILSKITLMISDDKVYKKISVTKFEENR